ncbi:MAG: nucleoside triphosphate pyrophosphohydrolase [Verrucomicrobiales bacterium]|jgi:tetrapyrrole methylase family protein/MazG family protein|nr:nucleoside triphosphate pyrophosphohydrolase [Verrucomicrobiales bacterium]
MTPAPADREPITRLKNIIARLRAPGGCPWDREQTHQSIKPQIIEECYEAVEAIDDADDALLKEELGDVLLHLVFHAQLAAERGAFTFDDVINGIADKLVFRHPHVFGENKLSDSGAVLRQWDELKKQEKPERTGALDGVAKSLPALLLAAEIQKKAAKVGFDWPDADGVLAKVREELGELERDLHDHQRAEEELGDLFFALVNLARFLKINPELAARAATQKFKRRFEWMEQHAAAPLKGQSLSALDALWNQAKQALG